MCIVCLLQEGGIASYCGNGIPRVPPFIIYCVQEIEKRGLHEVGLYRIPGYAIYTLLYIV